MRTGIKTLFPVFSFALVMLGCDTPGELGPGCEMHLSGARPTAPTPNHKPWAAVNLVGKGCSADDLAGVRISLFETEPALTYRGDATLVDVQPNASGYGGLCATYEWPEWASAETSWGVLATPAQVSEQSPSLRASWIASDAIGAYQPGGQLPAWNTPGEGWSLYLGVDDLAPSCTPPGT